MSPEDQSPRGMPSWVDPKQRVPLTYTWIMGLVHSLGDNPSVSSRKLMGTVSRGSQLWACFFLVHRLWPPVPCAPEVRQASLWCGLWSLGQSSSPKQHTRPLWSFVLFPGGDTLGNKNCCHPHGLGSGLLPEVPFVDTSAIPAALSYFITDFTLAKTENN